MICQPCRAAADARAPRDAHCHDPACMCGHRTDRYRTLTRLDALAAYYDGLQRVIDQTTEVQPRTAVRPISDARMVFPNYWTEDTTATPHTTTPEA